MPYNSLCRFGPLLVHCFLSKAAAAANVPSVVAHASSQAHALVTADEPTESERGSCNAVAAGAAMYDVPGTPYTDCLFTAVPKMPLHQLDSSHRLLAAQKVRQ